MLNSHPGIRRLSVKDFRGIDFLELDFVGPDGRPTRVVVLGGPNGSGKTSILEACLSAVGYKGELQGKTGSAAARKPATDYTIEIELQVDDQIFTRQLTSRSKPKQELPAVYFSSWRAPSLVGALGITAGRKGRRPDKNEANRLWNIKQYLVNARAHDLFPAKGTTPPRLESRYEQAIQDLNHVWQMFYPEETFQVEPVGDNPDEGFDVFLTTVAHGRLSVDLLSAGQLEIFSFAGELIVQEMQPGLVVIDEPELHLDSRWHRQILRAFQYLKPDCQILVATHSPEIFESVRSFERHFLTSANDPRVAAWDQRMIVQGKFD